VFVKQISQSESERHPTAIPSRKISPTGVNALQNRCKADNPKPPINRRSG